MKNIIRSMPGKIILYILTCACIIGVLLSACAAYVCYEEGLYDRNGSENIREMLKSDTEEYIRFLVCEQLGVANYLARSSVHFSSSSYSVPGNFQYGLVEGQVRTSKLASDDAYKMSSKYLKKSDDFDPSYATYIYYVEWDTLDDVIWQMSDSLITSDRDSSAMYTFIGYYEGGYPNTVQYAMYSRAINWLYRFRYDVYAIGIGCGIAAIVCYILLMCVSARRPKSEELHPGYLNRVPIDLMSFVVGLGFCMLIYIADEMPHEGEIIVVCIAVLYAVFAFVALSMSVAARVKQGSLLSNTMVWKVIKLFLRLVKKYVFGLVRKISGFLGGTGRGFRELIKKLPMIWRSVAIFAGITLMDGFVLFVCFESLEYGLYFLYWILMHIALFILFTRLVFGLRILQAGGRAIAAGDMDYKVDTGKLKWDFKEHGENLNHISEGMTVAVEEKMKSERMKTELITNVSHDIKTPLTSIINYADLIGREQTENEKIREYSEVLLRQSERLKRLIEDLVEASKASTGNMEMNMKVCEASMFITQIAGEYEEKLSKAHLSLITKGTEQSVKIMADGRRMLRVFDNLMNNICKYALDNSRVYLTLEREDADRGADSSIISAETERKTLAGDSAFRTKATDGLTENTVYRNGSVAVITFKNTSKNELDVSPEELMERFVRGDQSRNTEGNGLGLSIARSLTELMGGTFDLMIDGDLFKVVLKFPVKDDTIHK